MVSMDMITQAIAATAGMEEWSTVRKPIPEKTLLLMAAMILEIKRIRANNS
jgi:hypothetical protein